MATKRKKDPDNNLVERLADRGEEALSRLLSELNPRMSGTIDKAMSAKGRVDSASRAALTQIGLAAADEIKDLRSQLERLEKRLARLEGGTGSTASGKRSAKKSETKTTPSAKKGTTRVKKETDKAPSPPPGRAIGGGTGRGSTGGTPPAA
jgi:uncharacterized phage infection (PIP) family protein YhgE